MKKTQILVCATVLFACGAWSLPQDAKEPPSGPFGLSLVRTTSGSPVEVEAFFPSRTCSICHKQQRTDFKGSMHSVTHTDRYYRLFAELAREEASVEVYTYCSGCHAPQGVVSGAIPGMAEKDLPPEVTDGIGCDVCHQIDSLMLDDSPWGEPGNASFALNPGKGIKYGPLAKITATPAHDGEKREFLQSSEFCATCHTVIHPGNGLRIEHTYAEWKKSVYAEKGIQCQDCHMRSVEDAIEVARTLTPVKKDEEKWANKVAPRPISVHEFVGGNVEAGVLSKSPEHAELARQRLKSAATLAVETGERKGDEVAVDVVVTNVAAGHSLPTSLTELREMWVHLRVSDAEGKVLHESGGLDEIGDIEEGAIRFGAHTVDAAGNVTYKPWEAVGFAWKRLVPAKESVRDTVRVALRGASGPLTVEARLLYRTTPPKVAKMVMGEEAFEPEIVEMATARTRIEL